MGFHCVNCGGSMVFDVSLQQMRCEHCDSTLDPAMFDFRDRGIAVDRHYTDMTSFTCQNCGAELVSTDDSMVGFCPYCGGQSLVTQSAGQHEVERIIPFKVSKEQCSELYRTFARKIRYLPKEFKDPSYLQKFTGIYMPYYLFDARFGETSIDGEKTVERNRRYDVVNTYHYSADITGPYRWGAPCDASKYLDDEISDRVLPYDTAKDMPFNPAYLAGFYADASTVRPDVYYEDAASLAEENMVGAITEDIMARDGVTVKPGASVETEVTASHSTLFPMWFLTWRKDDRVAYAVVNGESGKVVSDLPLDLRAFAIGSVVISVALFLLLEAFVQPTPLVTSIISLVAALLMTLGVRRGAKRVFEVQTHANDKGWSGETSDPEARKKRRKGKTKKFGLSDLVTIALVLVVGYFYIGSFLDDNSLSLGLILKMILPIIVLCFVASTLFKTISWRKVTKDAQGVIASIVLLLSTLLNAAIVAISPVNDGWYYIGDAICIIGLVVAAVCMLRVYNLGTTRPLPKLFDREEV